MLPLVCLKLLVFMSDNNLLYNSNIYTHHLLVYLNASVNRFDVID